ncbi:hypothetical protein VRB14_14450 [Pseudomonas trivialis]
MRDKQIWELTENDLHDVGVWCFPMDESVEDECTVRPCVEEVGLAMIVRAEFCDVDGTRYLGYVHWSLVEHIGHRQPTLFLNDGTAVSFWEELLNPPGMKPQMKRNGFLSLSHLSLNHCSGLRRWLAS